MKSKQQLRLARREARRGVVAVEFALTAGLAFLFFFAAMEFSRVAMLHGTIDNAIYEGARVGIVPGATAGNVEQKVRDILGFSLVRVADISVQPNPILVDSTSIRVQVDLPLDRNTFSPARFFAGKSLVRTIQMKREASRFVPGG